MLLPSPQSMHTWSLGGVSIKPNSSTQPQGTDWKVLALSLWAPRGLTQIFNLCMKVQVMEQPHTPFQNCPEVNYLWG